MINTNTINQTKSIARTDILVKSAEVLPELITPQGIYASNAGLINGRFHHYFGRDSAITAFLIIEAEAISKDYKFTPLVLQALSSLAAYQGQKNNPETGEELGKIPHEVITSPKDIKILQNTIVKGGGQSWFIDSDGILKNWDSLDSTPLWVIAVCSAIKLGWEMPSQTTYQLMNAVSWCLRNLNDFGGYAGWLPSHLQAERKYGGLSNQAWKDSWSAFMENDGQLPIYPLHDIFSSAAMWAALNKSSALLANLDKELSDKAYQTAKQLKERFNSVNKGFKLEYEDFYAEALDKDFNQLNSAAIDVGMVMAFDHNNENIYHPNINHKLVEKLLGSDFYCEDFGMRTYQKDLNNYVRNDQYHRGPKTFWPFASALTAIGFARSGYINEAEKVIKAMLKGLENFDSFVELFIVNNGQAEIWKNADTNQTSTLNQAWTVAAAYYGAIYIEHF